MRVSFPSSFCPYLVSTSGCQTFEFSLADRRGNKCNNGRFTTCLVHPPCCSFLAQSYQLPLTFHSPRMLQFLCSFYIYIRDKWVLLVHLDWNWSFHIGFFFFFFLWSHQQHMGVPRLGVELELQPPTYTRATATRELSHICEPHTAHNNAGSFKPLSEARD